MKTTYKVQIFFESSHRETRPDAEQVIRWLISKGYKIEDSYYPDTLFVNYEGNIEGKDEFREKLDLYLLAMSERNSSACALLITKEFQADEESKQTVWFLVPPSDEGMRYFETISKSEEVLNKLKELRLFYAQLEPSMRLIYGLSLLEEWFDTQPEHCLSSDEQKEIIEKIRESILDPEKIDRVVNMIKDPAFLARKTRNRRITEAIHPYPGLDIEELEKKVKELFGSRAKASHTTANNNIQKQLAFLNSIFQIHLYKEHNFVKLNLH